MLEFKCMQCGASIGVEEGERSRPVVCLSCNTRQRVPENAVRVPDREVLAEAAVKERVARAPEAPAYNLLSLGSAVVFLVGILQCVIAIAAAADAGSAAPLLMILSGGVTIGFGALMLCIRDMAINTWHIRQHVARNDGTLNR